MKNHCRLIGLSLTLTASLPLSAQTTFNGSSTDLISDGTKWTNGLPTAANLGTLNINAKANATVLDGYDITHTAGTLSNSVTTLLALGTADYTLNGASAQISGFRQISNTAGGVFKVENGTITLASGADSTFNGEFIVNGGNVSFSRRLTGNGTITINGGTVSSTSTGTDNSIGGSNLATGDFYLNGGDIDFRFMQVGNAGIDFFFGGSTAGNLTIENFGGFRHNPSLIDLDFSPGSLMSLTLTNPVAFNDPAGDDRFGWANDNLGPFWAEALWSDGRLTFNGKNFIELGNWSTVNGTIFDYDSTTNTLALIPEPTSALAGLLLTAGLLRRRRSTTFSGS